MHIAFIIRKNKSAEEGRGMGHADSPPATEEEWEVGWRRGWAHKEPLKIVSPWMELLE